MNTIIMYRKINGAVGLVANTDNAAIIDTNVSSRNEINYFVEQIAIINTEIEINRIN